jgi:hypothetical protein
MTLEAALSDIANSLRRIADHLDAVPAPQPAPVVEAPAPAPVVEAPAPAPVPAPAPQPAPAPAPAPASAGVPTDAKSLQEYCMGKYRALGPVKGGMIQGILTELGCTNIHSLPVEKYAEFHAKVEAL